METEIERLKIKIADYQARLKELEQKKLEVENTRIIGLMREHFTSFRDLESHLENLKARDRPAENKSQHTTVGKEDAMHEN